MLDPENVEFRMKILSSHFTAFNRQISEAVKINRNKGPFLLNSKSEYNRSSLPGIKTTSGKKCPWEASDLEDYEIKEAISILKQNGVKPATKMFIEKKKREEEETAKVLEDYEEEEKEKETLVMLEEVLIDECEIIEKENRVIWKEREEEELKRMKEEEKEVDRERRLYRAKLQKEDFMRKYILKKKEKLNLKWSKELLAEKKSYWRKYREKEEEFDLDGNDKIELIAKLMTKIPVRKPKEREEELSENEFADNEDPRRQENEYIKPPTLRLVNSSLKCESKVNDTFLSNSHSESDKILLNDHGENEKHVTRQIKSIGTILKQLNTEKLSDQHSRCKALITREALEKPENVTSPSQNETQESCKKFCEIDGVGSKMGYDVSDTNIGISSTILAGKISKYIPRNKVEGYQHPNKFSQAQKYFAI